jgi:hypothetical protein
LNSLSEYEVDRELVRIAKSIDALVGNGDTVQVKSESEPADESDAVGPTDPVYERMRKALAEGKWAWRSIERLAAKAGVSEDVALAVLRVHPEIDLSVGRSGRQIARLRARRA